MKLGRIAAAFYAFIALTGTYAVAQIVTAFPFQLQNGQLADATQVMANFNQLLNGINTNAAKNGVNSDITQLLGLTVPIAPAVGGTTTWTGGTSTGSANAQVVASVVPSTFTLTAGTHVVFKAGFSNTQAMSLNVAGSGVKNIFRNTSLGVLGSVGGEVLSGAMIEVVYDGTQYQIIAPYIMIGEIREYTGATPPLGWLFSEGSCQPQVNFPALFSLIGTSWGSCGAGLFALPDYRGRVGLAPDELAGRVTVGGSGCTAVLTAGCGAQNQTFTIAQGNIPNYVVPNTLGLSSSLAVSNGTLAINNTMGVSDTRTWITSNALLPAGGATAPGAGGITGAATAQQAVVVNSGAIALTGTTVLTGAVSLTGSVSLTGGIASGGSGTAITLTTLQPTLVVNKIIKY